MALDWHQNFISAQYLENELTESDQNLYAHQHWQVLAWDCCLSFFAKFWRSYGPWLSSEFCFRSISCELIVKIWPNFVWTSTLTRSSLGLLPVIFRKILIDGPWLMSEFRFRSISWEQIDRIWPNFVCTSTLTRFSLGIWPVIFRKILEFHFCSISWEGIDRIWPKFVCTSTLTRSSLGLLPVIFRKILT